MNDDITPLEVLAEAVRDLRRHYVITGLYVAIWLPAGLLAVALAQLRPDDPAAPVEPARQLLFFGGDLVYAVVGAVAATVAFSRLGRELDRPLWKVPGDVEALRRFFTPWFIMLLALTAAQRLAIVASLSLGDETLYLVSLMVLVAGNAFMFVAGACIMFHGRHEWGELGEALQPVSRFPAHMLLLVLLGFVGYMLLLLAMETLPPLARLLPMAASLPIDALIFAGAWEVCRLHRDAPPEEDFDL